MYLFRVVDAEPKAKIPMVLFPAATPERDAALEAVADWLTQVEKIYKFLVVVAELPPNAKIPKVPVGIPVQFPNPTACICCAKLQTPE